ncbi:MAG: hypothetical protein K5643_08665 [Saccharofermentans sp.]|nr:hypothetical protein [Saccharofermentans sp.]
MGEKTKEKKKLKASDVIITVLVIGLIAFGGYYLVTNYLLAPNHTVVVNDKEIVMKNSAKELIDQGFVLCNVNGITADPLDDDVKAREICNMSYFIGIPTTSGHADCTGVEVTFANFMESDQKLKDCAIYELEYSPKFQDEGTKVLIDGVDLSKAELNTWADFFKEKQFPFSDKDLSEFTTGESLYISGTRDTHQYSAELDSESKADSNNKIYYEYSFGSFKITRDIKVEYKTK